MTYEHLMPEFGEWEVPSRVVREPCFDVDEGPRADAGDSVGCRVGSMR
jgi:hypothetical protein